jgi:membrane-bound lytic murein transglycosylase A
VTPFRKLMIAQDTGSAIVGPARADLYWGAGDDAGRIAGRLRHPGKFVMLLPRELDLIAAGKQMPLPLAKPKVFEDQTSTQEAKTGEEGTDAARAKVEETPKTSEKAMASEKAKPEPAKPEPVKTVAKPEVAKPDSAKSDIPKSDITGTTATKTDAATKSDATKIDAAKTDPTKIDAVKPDAAKSNAAKPDSAKSTTAAKSGDHGKTSNKPRRQAAPTQWWWRPW